MFSVELHVHERNSSKGFIYLLPVSLPNITLVFGRILDGFDVWCLSSKRFISVNCKRIDASNAICKAASVRTFGLSAILWFTDLQLRSYYGDPMSTLDLTRSHEHPNYDPHNTKLSGRTLIIIEKKDWLRLILPDPTAIRVGLSHASQRRKAWHTAQ